MTPAGELLAAADRLEALAAAATPDMSSFDDIEDVLFPEDLAYIAMMGPDVGLLLAKVLRYEADMIGVLERVGDITANWVGAPLLDLARAINRE